MAPPTMLPPPPCVPGEQMPPDELERLHRFAAIPDGYAQWQSRNCYPRRLDDPTLARTLSPIGTIVSIAGRDAVVTDPGIGWLGECADVGLPAAGAEEITGSDLLTAIDRIGGQGDLVAADIREIGIAKGKRAQGDGSLYALILGTPRTVIRVQCFEDVEALVRRAAAAMRQAERAAAW